MTQSEKVGIAAVGLGLLMVLGAHVFGPAEGFWAAYTDGVSFGGWLLLFIGAVWSGLSIASGRTSFFDSNRKMDADKFGLTLAATVVATIVILAVVIPRLPDTEPDKLPPDPNVKEQIVKRERNFRIYVSTSVICAGLAIVTIPAVRFFSK